MKGWLLIETLLVLLVANAIAWFVVAMGGLLPLPTLTPGCLAAFVLEAQAL